MPNYQIVVDAHRANYRKMMATAAIKRGEEILAEEPLGDLRVSISNLHDPDRFFRARGDFNGAKAATILRNQLPEDRKPLLDELQDYHPGRGTLIGRI